MARVCGTPWLLLRITKIVWEYDWTPAGNVQVGFGVKFPPVLVPPSTWPPAAVYVLSTRAFVSMLARPSFRNAASVGEASRRQRWSRSDVLAQSLPTQNSMFPDRSTDVRLAKPLLVSAT